MSNAPVLTGFCVSLGSAHGVMNARLQMLRCERVTYDTRVLAGNIYGIKDTLAHVSRSYGRSVQISAISKASFPQREIESTIRCAIEIIWLRV